MVSGFPVASLKWRLHVGFGLIAGVRRVRFVDAVGTGGMEGRTAAPDHRGVYRRRRCPAAPPPVTPFVCRR